MSAPQGNAAGSDPHKEPKQPDNGETGLPGLHTWPRVYALVLGCFILWMILLFGLGRLFG